jgi:hypothetical protein
MARHFRTESAHRRFSAELARKAIELRQKYGPVIDWENLQRVLHDPQFAPFPCEIRFDAKPLLPGEFAHTIAPGPQPGQGYVICLHPQYASQLARVSYLVLHQLVLINYGACATADDAETFGALALGLSREDYYQALCELSGQLGDELV